MYYLAIIGGGPAGYTAAAQVAKAGKEVILFEQNAIGGTCLNVGCIPTKTLLYSAKTYYNAANAAKYGVITQGVQFDYAKIQQRKQKVVRKLAAGIRAKLNNPLCTLVTAEASVVSRTDDKVIIRAAENDYEAENLLICTGSTNFVPPIPGLKDNPFVLDSTDALNLTELPSSVIIVGGGVIGMEFATLFHELGIKVTVIEAMPAILPNLDNEVVDILLQKYKKEGVEVFTNTRVTRVEDNQVFTEQATFSADKILVCVGRKPNLNGLEALSDLQLNRKGIEIDEFMRTNLHNVYAAGDVTGKLMLAHTATRQAEVAVGRMLKQLPLQRIAYNAIPSVVYTNPEIAAVGLTEADLTGKDCVLPIPYEVKKLPMAFSGRFVAENEAENGLCKIIIDQKKQTVLGVSIVGNPCSEIIAAASFAVRMGYTVAEFQQVVFPHPTVAEILREAVIE